MQNNNILGFLDNYMSPVLFTFFEWFTRLVEYIESNSIIYSLWLFFCFANVIVTVWYFLCSFTELTGNSIFYGNLYKSVSEQRQAKRDEQYRLRKAENRAEAEERYQQRLSEAEERRQQKLKIREEAFNRRNIYIGEQHFSDEALASAYFNQHPKATKFFIGGKTYWNMRGLENMASEEFGDDYENNNKWLQYQRRQQNVSNDDNE